MNIPDSILRLAERLGLDATSTGGGLDYIMKELGKNDDGSDRVLLLSAYEDAGSPERLNSKASLILMLDEEWVDSVAIDFKTAKEALQAMPTFNLDRNGMPRDKQ
jgi:hypothetical protein